MTIHRIDKDRNFTVISNAILDDRSISLAAKGLLLQMLSRPDSWHFSEKRLAAGNKEGLTVIRRALAELESAGYLQRRRTRCPNGIFRGCNYDIFESPAAAAAILPAAALPTSALPTAALPAAALPAAATSSAAACLSMEKTASVFVPAAAAVLAPAAVIAPPAATASAAACLSTEKTASAFVPAAAAVLAPAAVIAPPAATASAAACLSTEKTAPSFVPPVLSLPSLPAASAAAQAATLPTAALPFAAMPTAALPLAALPAAALPSSGFPSTVNLSELLNTEVTRTDKANTDRTNTEKENNQIIKEIDKSDAIAQARAFYRGQLQENIDYRELLHDAPCDREIIAELTELILDAVTSQKEYLRIGGEEQPSAVVKKRFLGLQGDHIRYVLECLQNTGTKVHNIRQYLLTALFNAPTTIANYYAAQVRHDYYENTQPLYC